jgi:anhydro-N-acetylmuramic acid kinase
MTTVDRFIGLMSGTSLDGVDAILADFKGGQIRMAAHYFLPYDEGLRLQLLSLHESRIGELHDAAIVGNRLAQLYARAVNELLRNAGVKPTAVRAIGCHGQTVRHRPELGYTIQLGNSALLAELTGIDVISDFRSRDIAAGGQGAPLVPAFHQAVFSHPKKHRVIVNIGGIANVTDLAPGGKIFGFDTGPGNILLDAWIQRHLGRTYDENGNWARSGQVIPSLLDVMLAFEFFACPPPKSTGRDTFNLDWVTERLRGGEKPEDVQATLLKLTAMSIAQAVRRQGNETAEIYLCGGGAHNRALVEQLQRELPAHFIAATDELGVGADWVEACAFAWLAQRCVTRLTGNLAEATGARGARILGAIYPA